MNVRERRRFCALFLLIFVAAASGYRYLSLAYSGDSTLIYQGNEVLYQVSLGRFLQPVYWMIRGRLVTPYLVGLFASGFFLLSAFLISSFLDLRRRSSLIVLCALLVTNETISLSNATYLPWTDVYALSLLCVCAGVWLDSNKRYGFLLSPFLYMCTLALYPSYITCAAVLLVLHYLVCLLRGGNPGEIWGKGIKSVLSLFLGLLLYALVLKIVLAMFGISASNEYNGVGRLEEITPASFLRHLPEAYMLPLHFFFNPRNRLIIPSHQALIPAWLNLCFLALSLILFFIWNRKRSATVKATCLFLILVLPFAMCFVYLISDGIINGLMIFSFYFFYLLPFLVLEALPAPDYRRMGVLACLLATVLVGINIKTSNRLAVKRDVEYASTLSAVTRILKDAEDTPGYVPGETPVVINGYLPASRIAMIRDGFEDLNPLQGARYPYAAAYEISNSWYIRQILGESMKLLDHEDASPIRSRILDEGEMPRYPETGYVRMQDGMLLINL